MMKNNNALLLIDCQNDFIDDPQRPGALAVAGAYNDMQRIAQFIDKNAGRLGGIIASLDFHHAYDIAHPSFWLDSAGKPAAPFTIIKADMVRNRLYRAARPEHAAAALHYLDELEKHGRSPLCVWPEHCLTASPGSNIHAIVYDKLMRWERLGGQAVSFVIKGAYPFSEHYSIFAAEVTVADEPSTVFNRTLLEQIMLYDTVYIAGEALSHCVRYSVEDMIRNLPAEARQKLVMLTDCSSPVPGFEKEGEAFLKTAEAAGIRSMLSSEAVL
jgi:nicotinamidase/pyrazinamidase